jgi:mRNA interferase MazF
MIASTPEPARGEVWYARLDPIVGDEQGGERPCVIVSDDHLRIDPPEGGLKAVSVIKCEDVRSISKQRLQSRWGRVSAKTLATVGDRLRTLLNL